MYPNAPAKIWVPRSYVESGIPRGGELVKEGTEKVIQTLHKPAPQPEQPEPSQQPVVAAAPQSLSVPAKQQAASEMAPISSIPVNQRLVAAPLPQTFSDRLTAPAGATSALKIRIALLELGQNGLALPLYEDMRRTGMEGVLDPSQTALLAQYATITNESEKAAFAMRLQQDYGANALIYLSAPEGVAAGKTIVAEFYDTMGGGLVRKFEAVIPFGLGPDEADKKTAVTAIMTTLTEKIQGLAALIPWYGRITAVDGKRAYIAAGKEAGMCIGKILKIYKNGKFVQGLGYAPGERVGTLKVEGFVGPNGSFGTIVEGQEVQATDVVSSE
jgi:hypothetical protein